MPCAEYLLSLDTVDVNFPDEHGRTLLSQTILNSAVDQTLLDRLTFLVEKKGADVTKTDTDNWSPVGFPLNGFADISVLILQVFTGLLLRNMASGRCQE